MCVLFLFPRVWDSRRDARRAAATTGRAHRAHMLTPPLPLPFFSPSKTTTTNKTAIKCAETLAVLGKLVYNTAVAPKDPKFRRVKLSNAKIAATVGSQPEALRALELLGWTKAEEGAEGAAADLDLPEAVILTMAQHRLVLAAQDALASASLRRNFGPAAPSAAGSASAHSSAGNLAALQQQPPQ